MTEIKHEIHSDGTESWAIKGMLHREDGPAIIRADGTQKWYLNGQRHRRDGPAVIRANGIQEWRINGHLHREDGPAVVHKDGAHQWILRGQHLTFQEWLDKVCLTDQEKTLMILRWSEHD